MPALTYDEDGKVKEILDEELGFWNAELTAGRVPSVMASVNKLYTSGSLIRFFDIIFKPLPALGRWNAYVLKRKGIPRAEILRTMTNPQMGRVITDFFIVNAGWMSGYLSFGIPLLSNLQTIDLIPNLLRLKNPLSRSQAAT